MKKKKDCWSKYLQGLAKKTVLILYTEAANEDVLRNNCLFLFAGSQIVKTFHGSLISPHFANNLNFYFLEYLVLPSKITIP